MRRAGHEEYALGFDTSYLGGRIPPILDTRYVDQCEPVLVASCRVLGGDLVPRVRVIRSVLDKIIDHLGSRVTLFLS